MGEIRGLQWGYVADGLVTVRRAVDTRNNVGAPKHDRLRRVPVSSTLASALAAAPRRGL